MKIHHFQILNKFPKNRVNNDLTSQLFKLRIGLMNQLKRNAGINVDNKVENAHIAIKTVWKDIAAEEAMMTTEIVQTRQ